MGAIAATFFALLNAGANSMGMLAELNFIAAAVIGGTSLAGGQGTIYGAILGAVIMQSLDSGMVLLGISSAMRQLVIGAVLILAVWFDVVYSRNRPKARIESPRDAHKYGIETIYQTLALADNLNAPANLFLGREIMTTYGTLDDRAMESDVKFPLLLELEANQTWPYEISGPFEQSNSQDIDETDGYVWGEVVVGDAAILIETRGSVLDAQGIRSGDGIVAAIRPGQNAFGVQIYEVVDIRKK